MDDSTFDPSCLAIDLVGMLTRSKAIWKNPDLLKLVESTPSPNNAYKVVFQKTGSRRKAKAGREFRMAMRDYGEYSPGTLVRFIQLPHGAEQLEKLLTLNPDHVRKSEQKKAK
jgi:hypothetical protein